MADTRQGVEARHGCFQQRCMMLEMSGSEGMVSLHGQVRHLRAAHGAAAARCWGRGCCSHAAWGVLRS